MKQSARVPFHELGIGLPAQGAALSALAGEAVFVVPDVAWGGLHELHQRALGETGPFRMVGVDVLTPLEAAGRYDWSSGMVLGQLWVEGPAFGAHVVDSIAGYVDGGGSLHGLEGLLASAGLTADRDGEGQEALDLAAAVLRGGISEYLGAGRDATFVMDAASRGAAPVAADAIQSFARQGVDGAELLRGALELVRDQPGTNAPHAGGGGGGGFSVVLGAITAGLGLAASAVFPPAAPALVAAGVSLVADGLRGERHVPEARSVEVHRERIHERETRPDGTVVDRTREVVHTRFVMTDGRRDTGGAHDDHGRRAGDRLWDDSGGGYDEDGRPVPIDPAAVLWCPPADEFGGGLIDGPRRNDLGVIDGYGPYRALEAILEAPAPEGDAPLDVGELFADWTVTVDGSLVPPAEIEVDEIEVDLTLARPDDTADRAGLRKGLRIGGWREAAWRWWSMRPEGTQSKT